MQQPASVQCKILLQGNTNKISTPLISLTNASTHGRELQCSRNYKINATKSQFFKT